MDFETWLKFGYDNGWVGPPVCVTHDGMPMTASEEEGMYEEDLCIHGLRLYEDVAQKLAVEENHSPSEWRASNRGLTE